MDKSIFNPSLIHIYYFQYFVFDYHMAPVMLYDKIISFTVSRIKIELLHIFKYFRKILMLFSNRIFYEFYSLFIFFCILFHFWIKIEKFVHCFDPLYRQWIVVNVCLQVMQRQFLRSGKILASFKLDVATVMQQPGIAVVFKQMSIQRISWVISTYFSEYSIFHH